MFPLAALVGEVLEHPAKASSLAKKYLGRTDVPFFVSMDVTEHCNLLCEGCDYPLLMRNGNSRSDPPLRTLEERLDTLHQAFGSMLITLGGFEPTVRKDLPELFARANVHHYPGMITNGTLITENTARAYWAAGMKFVNVSIPSFDEDRFARIIGVGRYNLAGVQQSIETLLETAPAPKLVTIAATIDNQTAPEELRRLAAYAQSVGAFLSFQVYNTAKPASVPGYYPEKDKRKITSETVLGTFGGSISERIIELQMEYPVIVGRHSILRNFDRYVEEGRIPFRARTLKINTQGALALFPEGAWFANMDVLGGAELRREFQSYVDEQMRNGGLYGPCYRCVNLTNDTPFLEMVQNGIRALRTR